MPSSVAYRSLGTFLRKKCAFLNGNQSVNRCPFRKRPWIREQYQEPITLLTNIPQIITEVRVNVIASLCVPTHGPIPIPVSALPKGLPQMACFQFQLEAATVTGGFHPRRIQISFWTSKRLEFSCVIHILKKTQEPDTSTFRPLARATVAQGGSGALGDVVLSSKRERTSISSPLADSVEPRRHTDETTLPVTRVCQGMTHGKTNRFKSSWIDLMNPGLDPWVLVTRFPRVREVKPTEDGVLGKLRNPEKGDPGC